MLSAWVTDEPSAAGAAGSAAEPTGPTARGGGSTGASMLGSSVLDAGPPADTHDRWESPRGRAPAPLRRPSRCSTIPILRRQGDRRAWRTAVASDQHPPHRGGFLASHRIRALRLDPEHLAEGSPTGPESPSPDTPDSRARVRPWGHFPSWKPIFLESLAEIPNVSGACRRAGINRAYAYEAREADPDFKASWDEALATSADALEESIWRRVINGESDRLAESLLRAHKPDLYGDKRTVEMNRRERRARPEHEHLRRHRRREGGPESRHPPGVGTPRRARP